MAGRNKDDINIAKAAIIGAILVVLIVFGLIGIITQYIDKKKKEDREEYYRTKCYIYDCENKKLEGYNYCSEHKCAEPGCDFSRTFGTVYCAFHAWENDPVYRAEREKAMKMEQELEAAKAKNDDGKSGSSKNNSSGSSSGKSSGSSSGSSSGKSNYDPYDVYDYHSAEDFADEWEDDFDDWEDAYEYWEESR